MMMNEAEDAAEDGGVEVLRKAVPPSATMGILQRPGVLMGVGVSWRPPAGLRAGFSRTALAK